MRRTSVRWRTEYRRAGPRPHRQWARPAAPAPRDRLARPAIRSWWFRRDNTSDPHRRHGKNLRRSGNERRAGLVLVVGRNRRSVRREVASFVLPRLQVRLVLPLVRPAVVPAARPGCESRTHRDACEGEEENPALVDTHEEVTFLWRRARAPIRTRDTRESGLRRYACARNDRLSCRPRTLSVAKLDG